MTFFRSERISERIACITDVAGTHFFLVEGDSSAVLIDTGSGCGDLGDLITSITALPVKCILTHGHVDHAMGSGCFEQVWLHENDRELYAAHSQAQVRLGYIRGSAQSGGDPVLSQQVSEADLQPVHPVDRLLPLQVGDRFDLGGVTVEICPGCGHTQGCVTILLPELRTLILGDACNGFTFLFDQCASGVSDYRTMLCQLKEMVAGRYDTALVCHGPVPFAPADMIDSVIAVCDDVLAGRADNLPFAGFNGEPALIAKAMDFRRFCRVDGGAGNIVYNPDNL